MVKTYRSARGEIVDFDKIRLSNETAIAVGNMKTNARGDELGPGGKIIKTRAQAMAEYHKLNTPTAKDTVIKTPTQLEPTLKAPEPEPKAVQPTTTTKPRGSLADSVAQETEK